MEQRPSALQKCPRANRSKKTLPAAFCSRDPHVVVQAPGTEPRAAAAAPSGGACGSSSSSPPHTGAHPASGLQLRPPLVIGWAAGVGSEAAERREGGIRLDSLVFLSSCPQRHGHFATKKMLHPPSLRLFCLVELPGAGHQRDVLRTCLQDWLRRWCALQAERPDLLVEVCETYWDAPVGYPMGILCEYMPLGSLDELIQACGGLPEEAMREISQSVLEALDALHSASPPLVHGYLKPSQVLFGVDGRPKLTFGLDQRLKSCQVWSLPSSHGSLEADAAGGEPATRAGSASAEQSCVVDIFDLGLLLLVSALGGLDILLDAIPYAREFGSQRAMRGPSTSFNGVAVDTCALLQHELRGAFRGDAEGVGGSDVGYLPPASDLLFNRRYSGSFLAFVSTCLQAHTQSTPVTARDLLQHEFLREQATGGPLVTLQEMQALARLLNEAPSEHDPSRFGPAKSARPLAPGVAPSVAQSAQLYLMNIAQSIAPYWGSAASRLAGGGGGGTAPRPAAGEDGEAALIQSPWLRQEWETLLTDTSRTLGLQRSVVQEALQAQIDRLLHSARGQQRHRAGSDM